MEATREECVKNTYIARKYVSVFRLRELAMVSLDPAIEAYIEESPLNLKNDY